MPGIGNSVVANFACLEIGFFIQTMRRQTGPDFQSSIIMAFQEPDTLDDYLAQRGSVFIEITSFLNYSSIT